MSEIEERNARRLGEMQAANIRLEAMPCNPMNTGDCSQCVRDDPNDTGPRCEAICAGGTHVGMRCARFPMSGGPLRAKRKKPKEQKEQKGYIYCQQHYRIHKDKEPIVTENELGNSTTKTLRFKHKVRDLAFVGELAVLLHEEYKSSRISVYHVAGDQWRYLRAWNLPPQTTAHHMTANEEFVLVSTSTPSSEHTVLQFGLDGKHLNSIGRGTLSDPRGICMEGGRIYVADAGNDCIRIFDSQGTLIGTWECDFSYPVDVAISQNKLYVADSYNDRIQVLDLDGKCLMQFGENGIHDGEFMNPGNVTIFGELVYVADTVNGRIQSFEAGDGEFVACCYGFSVASSDSDDDESDNGEYDPVDTFGISVAHGRLWLCDVNGWIVTSSLT